MKPIRFTLLFMFSLACASVFAQAPQKFNYQAVARDASGNPHSEKNIAVRISIIEGSAGGASLYSETFAVTTGKQGLFAIQVGGGTPVSGTFGAITWASGSRFLKVEIDPAGGSTFVSLGTSQLLSVPYALAADKLSSPMSIAELGDVSGTTPAVDDVLKWNGTEWVPGAGVGGTVTTSSSLSGSGSSASPLTIAQQNASSGQVLQWNGTAWTPASISGGVGDNWGTQNVVTSAVLSGSGTAAAPLTIANTGASNGSVLKYNGTTWAPGADAGDNWGTAKVNTSTQFEGDGTPGSPLKLSGNSAEVGETLVWNGTSWLPGTSGGLSLPFSESIGVVSTAFQISTSGGPAIEGATSNNGPDMAGVRGIVTNATAGVGSTGVLGKNMSGNGNGYGVFGLHESPTTGMGVFGESKGGAGYGVYGKANGANGIGVYGASSGTFGYGIIGLANTGVSGTTNTANGNGIYGNATSGGYAGWFDAKVVIKANSTAAAPTLTIRETDAADFARLRFDNNNLAKFWDLTALTTANLATDRFKISNWNGNEVMSITGDGAVGLGTATPLERLDVAGTIRFTGGLRVGGTLGNNGQVLQSTGAGVTWASPTNGAFNNTYLWDQTGTGLTVSTSVNGANEMAGLDNMSFTISTPSRVTFTFNHSSFTSNGTGDVGLEVEIGFINDANGQIVNRVVCRDFIPNNRNKTFSYTHHCFFGTAGTYRPYVYLGTSTAGQYVATGAAGTTSSGQVNIQVNQQ